jgi:hypothetical protein
VRTEKWREEKKGGDGKHIEDPRREKTRGGRRKRRHERAAAREAAVAGKETDAYLPVDLDATPALPRSRGRQGRARCGQRGGRRKTTPSPMPEEAIRLLEPSAARTCALPEPLEPPLAALPIHCGPVAPAACRQEHEREKGRAKSADAATQEQLRLKIKMETFA